MSRLMFVWCCGLIYWVYFASADDLTNFFLKASKNVPRIGRNGGKDNTDIDLNKFFLKASKSVPRIGRRIPSDFEDRYFKWLKQNGLIPRFVKRTKTAYDDIADAVELNPEVLLSPQKFTEMLQSYYGISPADISEMDNLRYKRNMAASPRLNAF